MEDYNGLGLSLGNLSKVSTAKTRSISPENFTGEKGKAAMATSGTGKECARELGAGWKVSPSIIIKGESTITLAEIDGPGAISHIWLTCHPTTWRTLVLRFYWDEEVTPSVEVPVGDFFCNGWGERSNVTSIPIAVNPAGGMNSYFEMPFKKFAKITIENLDINNSVLYYQISYTLTDIQENMAYFHAQWRRNNPLRYKEVHTIVDGIEGVGQYIGTYLAWGTNNDGWWGEGEIKFFMDGDKDFPTICGTGTEDYFGGAWDFEQPQGQYCAFSNLYTGFHQVTKSDGLYKSQQRFGMYRWHIMDPIRFEKNIKVTIQALGWRSNGRYLPLQEDIASVGFWYQVEPHASFPNFPDKNNLEVI